MGTAAINHINARKRQLGSHLIVDDSVNGDTAYYAFVDAASKHDALGFLSSQRRRQREPEMDLLEAILQEALLAMNATENKKNKGVKADAMAWFQSDDENWIFSFVNVCEALNISHTEVRSRVFSHSIKRKMYRKSDSYWKLQKRGPRNKIGDSKHGATEESYDHRSGRPGATGEPDSAIG